MEDRDWDILLQSIRDEQCVLVLGPDSARLADDEENLTLTDRLARELCDGDDAADAARPDLLHAAQNRIYDNEDHFYYDVRQFLERYDATSSELHRRLSRLPFSLCVQTSPDRFLYNALTEAGKQPIEAYFDFSDGGGRVKVVGEDRSALMECSPDRPLIFSLHGHMADPRSLVLTRNDTLDFLVSLSESAASLPSFLVRHVGSSDTRFLFFGFGFNRWYSQMLLHVLRKEAIRHRRVGRSIAIEPDSFFAQDSQQIATFYHREHSIDFEESSFHEFTEALASRYDAMAGTESRSEAVTVAHSDDMPLVFLCYNRQDEANVRRLARALEDRGLRVWWDHGMIKGGDHWSVKLQHAIGELVDYFVVIHSTNFASREAYSGKEVKAALDRSDRFFGTGWRFIIPCHFMGERDRLHALQEFDYAIVDEPEACDEIVDTVIDDWSRNKRLDAKKAQAS